MKLLDLPVHKVSRVLTEDEATKLVGTVVPDRDPTINTEGIWYDGDTGEPIIAYLPMEDNVEALRRAVLRIKYGMTVRQTTGMRNESRTFGMAPRKAYQKRESCRPTALAHEQPEEHSVLVALADQFAKLFADVLPDVASHDKTALTEISDEWRMAHDAMWTSGVVNRSSALPYHRDGFNFATWSAMPVVRKSMSGGYLDIPEYEQTVSCRDGWVVLFPGYKYVHGVTPMHSISKTGYRYSVVYYALRGMKDCFTYAVETAEGRKRRTDRETHLALAIKGEEPFRATPKVKAVP